MEKFETYGHIDEKGKFFLHNRQRFEEWARTYPGKDVAIKFERKARRRTDPQNKYYWAVVVREITVRLRQLGHQWITDEDTHDFLKVHFNCEQIVGEGGEVMDLPKKTCTLTTVQFSEYVERVRIWAADFLCINILDPNTQAQMIFND